MPVAVGADGDDPGAVRRVGAGVEQGLQVGAGAGDEDDEAEGGGHAREGYRRCSAALTRPTTPASRARWRAAS